MTYYVFTGDVIDNNGRIVGRVISPFYDYVNLNASEWISFLKNNFGTLYPKMLLASPTIIGFTAAMQHDFTYAINNIKYVKPEWLYNKQVVLCDYNTLECRSTVFNENLDSYIIGNVPIYYSKEDAVYVFKYKNDTWVFISKSLSAQQLTAYIASTYYSVVEATGRSRITIPELVMAYAILYTYGVVRPSLLNLFTDEQAFPTYVVHLMERATYGTSSNLPLGIRYRIVDLYSGKVYAGNTDNPENYRVMIRDIYAQARKMQVAKSDFGPTSFVESTPPE